MSMRAIVVAGFWVQLTVAAFVAYPSVYVLVGSIAPFAFFAPTLTAVVIGYRVAVTPDRLTGRVNSIARSIALCGAPLGPLAAGILLGAFSARTAVAVFTVLLVVLAVVGSLSPSIRNAPSLTELEPLPTEPRVVPEPAG
jgi:MFS family permease